MLEARAGIKLCFAYSAWGPLYRRILDHCVYPRNTYACMRNHFRFKL